MPTKHHETLLRIKKQMEEHIGHKIVIMHRDQYILNKVEIVDEMLMITVDRDKVFPADFVTFCTCLTRKKKPIPK